MVNPIAFFRRLEAQLADDAVLVVDGGGFVATGSYVLRPRAPRSWLDPGVFGTLGVGGGFAVGAALCRPGVEVWLVYGDGASAYSLAEIDTCVSPGLPPATQARSLALLIDLTTISSAPSPFTSATVGTGIAPRPEGGLAAGGDYRRRGCTGPTFRAAASRWRRSPPGTRRRKGRRWRPAELTLGTYGADLRSGLPRGLVGLSACVCADGGSRARR